jgi:amino acid adenylation domain-containing protein/non-ribosomal peptide synthase protein (TIGR01720 family)
MNKTNNIEDAYILSPMQQGMLFHSLYAPEFSIYLEQFSYEITGELNQIAFENAWQKVVDRHSVLRTAFIWQNIEQPHQVVGKKVKLPWYYYDWKELNTEQQQENLDKLLKSDRNTGFSLSRAPLMRFSLIHLAKNRYQFIWTHHHLILDGWSVSLLLKEVMDFYQALSKNRELQLEKPQPYRNYIAWLQQQDKSQAETFWRKQLTGFTSPTSLGIDCQSIVLSTNDLIQKEQQLQLSAATTTALQSFIKRSQITLNTLIQGLWSVILSCYSGEKDIVFGATSSGRPVSLSGADSIVGLFINTLPVRINLDTEIDLISWLQELQNKQLEIRQYEYSSLSEIQQWSEISQGIPLFESIVVFQNLSVDTEVQAWISSLNIRHLQAFQQTNYPLNIVVELNPNLEIKIDYDSRRFDTDAITRMLGHWQNLLEAVVNNPQAKLSELSLLTAAERQQLLFEWNKTEVEYPIDKCIHTLFEEQVAKTPDATAIVFENQQLTYQELNSRANQLAHYLRQKTVGNGAYKHLRKPQMTAPLIPESSLQETEIIIGICLNRSLEMIVGILGILKAGFAYLPIDSSLPRDRVSYILTDAKIPLLLTQSNLTPQLPEAVETICLDTDWQIISKESDSNLNFPLNSGNLAYCIYTSGSTGTPKGVMIQHDSLVNFVCGAVDKYQISQQERVLQFASLSFDAAVEEIYPCLICGGTLVLRSEAMLNYGELFFQKCLELQITVLDLPTAYWHQLMSDIESTDLMLPECIRLVIIGGEKAKDKDVAIWQDHVNETQTLINTYGPTEATVVTTSFQLPHFQEDKPIKLPIGKPFPNVKVYVLNSDLQPVPIGIPGELYIGGVGVARGYLNQPELTKEKFVSIPPSPLTKGGLRGDLLYKTGDLVKYLPDGNLEFIARVDHQVKIRGFRVELEEVEMALNQHPLISNNVVIFYEDELSNKNLIAYFTLAPNSSVTNLELREFLQSKLPNYAIPKAFIKLETLPLTTTGKIDRKSLPAPDVNQLLSATNFVAPTTPIEKTLAKIWSAVLGIEKIGINDNFFEIGGDSIISIQIVAKANRVGLLLEPRQLFQHQTIAQLARVATVSKAELETVTIPLTPSQSQFISQNQIEFSLGNHSLSLEIDSSVQPKLLEIALHYLIQYHDSFHFSFIKNESGWQQVYNHVNNSVNNKEVLTEIDLSALPESEQKKEITSVSLSAKVPIKFVLFDLGKQQNKILLIISHYLICDRFSYKIIIEDLKVAYQQLVREKPISLPTMRASFKEWSQYLQEYSKSDKVLQEKDYWLAQKQKPFIKLPVDSWEEKKVDTQVVSIFLSQPKTKNLRSNLVHKAYNTKVEDLLLTALVLTFTKWTEKQQIWIDFITHSRPERINNLNLSRTVGQFTNCYPISFELTKTIDVGTSLITVKEHLRTILERGISYSISRSEIKSKLPAYPQPEVSFNYLGNWDVLDNSDLLKLIPSDSFFLNSDVQQFSEIEVKAFVLNGKFQCYWQYNQALYRRETIETRAKEFIEFLQDLIIHCQSLEEKKYTASDFPQANLSQQKLDKFLAKIERGASNK